MASWDFIDSITEDLKKEKNYDFIVIGLQKGKIQNNVNCQFSCDNKKSAAIFLEVLDNLAGELISILESPARRKKKK